ncbi:MAG: TolC family protein [Pseudomonadota bacterium]|nr:TolC family protein [Pseudomonadota bacterium]
MLAWLMVAPATAAEWTLRATLDHALAHNIELRQDDLDLRTSQASVVIARADRGPTLSADTSVSGYFDAAAPDATDDGAAWSLGVSQPLPTGGTVWLGGSQSHSSVEHFAGRLTPDASAYTFTGLTIDQPLLDGAWRSARYAVDDARLGLRAVELRVRDAKERLVVEVATAYWQLIAAREGTRLAVRSVEIAEAQLGDTRERFDEGFAGSGDVLQLERALGVARQSRVVAEAAERGAARRLARLMGLPLEDAAVLDLVDRPDPPAADPDPVAALAEAREANAVYRLATLDVDDARRGLAEARSAALPDLSVSAAVGLSATTGGTDALSTLTTNPDRAWAVGASLTVPLAWAGPRAALEQGRIGLSRAELGAEAAWQDLVAQVQAALDAVGRDRVRVALAEQTRLAAQAGLAADQELYREGRGSTRDVVRSLELLEEAQVAGLAAQIDLQASLLDIARLRGRVLLDLGVP